MINGHFIPTLVKFSRMDTVIILPPIPTLSFLGGYFGEKDLIKINAFDARSKNGLGI